MDLAPFDAIDPCGYPGLAGHADRATLGFSTGDVRRDAAKRSRARSSCETSDRPAMREAGRQAEGRGARRRASPSRSCRARRCASPTGSACSAAGPTRASTRSSRSCASRSCTRLRGSLLPEHRRVLRQRHRDLHDPGRHVHAPLPVLRRRARPARAARRRGAAPPGARPSRALKLAYVVITSVDRDDLRDGGAQHFVDCIRAVRALSPATRIEILTPDFRGRHGARAGDPRRRRRPT